MNVAVVGYGEQGRSAFEYWFDQGHVVVVCDQQTDIELPAAAIDKLGDTYLEDLHEFDLIVRSPAVHPQTILDANPDHPEIIEKITSNTNEFMKVCKATVIGVTGTKGKGTTSTLIAKILEAAGKKVHLGGNIGVPPLDMLKDGIEEKDFVVLELANFQLIDLRISPHIAVCLMIVDEHLDWHKDTFEYVRAKQQLFVHQKHDDITIYNADNVYSTEIASSSPAHTKIPYEVPEAGRAPEFTDGAYLDGEKIMMRGHHVCSVEDVKLFGRHNLQNVCAAIAATWDLIDHKDGVVKKALAEFTGLEHRLENLGTHNGVTFIDDSFGTNPATAIVAVQAFTQPKVLIVGGSDKGTPFNELAEVVLKNNVRHIIGIGEMGPKIISTIEDTPGATKIPYTMIGTDGTMQQIVNAAVEVAQPGDVVLLSTACASFDMFKNYKDRGEQFKAAVKALG